MPKKTEDKLKKVRTQIGKYIIWIEVLLAFLIIFTVILSIKDLAVLAITIFKTDAISSYEILQGFLTHTLLLVVGLELALMLISHTPGKVLEVVLYAIARKMLISSANMTDILFGVIALTLVFFIDKYLHTKNNRDMI
ncbi:hypothetical protein [Clostridium sp. Cult3]|uniref:hypothetical protein n=1 Tax=Clostridium sp. Cult3 TaxID=2079004 RepID=UPI001F284F8E|nr:hypothetical protein [Clostridium sp. Cult3]MCF6459649.1 hypothetical protein [Clostridium sp. Cult3]